MCGIYACLSKRNPQGPSADLTRLLCTRGPDYLGQTQIQTSDEIGETGWIHLTSTVLALRGGHITKQPFNDITTGSALCWNGEAWRLAGRAVTGNDGEAIFKALLEATHATSSSTDCIQAVLRTIRSISGPYAFVYYSKSHDLVFFGRDRLGRRSLLYENSGEDFQISSISEPIGGSWREVEADAVYVIRASSKNPILTAELEEDSSMSKPNASVYKCSWNWTGMLGDSVSFHIWFHYVSVFHTCTMQLH
jgi:asparagine synthetase B (glutamine-hydrolysing)